MSEKNEKVLARRDNDLDPAEYFWVTVLSMALAPLGIGLIIGFFVGNWHGGKVAAQTVVEGRK